MKGKNKDKIALLVTSNNDIRLLDEFPNATYVALDYTILQLNPGKNLEYFLQNSNYDANISSLAFDIASRWYRDKNGNDLSVNPFSMGLILEWRLGVIIASIIRYHSAFNEWLKRVDFIVIPESVPTLFKEVALCFSSRVKFIDSRHTCYEPFTFPMKHYEVCAVSVKGMSALARMAQYPFFKKNQGKILCFSDWTYEKQKNKHFLYMNSHNLLNGFYLNSNVKRGEWKGGDTLFNHSHEIIKNMLKDFPVGDSNLLSDLVFEKIKSEFFLVKEKAEFAYSLYKELLEFYKPTSIILPGTTDPWHLMIMQIASSLHIPVLIVLDGYRIYMNEYEFPIDRNGNKTLVKNCAVMGRFELMTSEKYSMVNKIRIRPPLLDHYDNIECGRVGESYGAMILFPYPVLSNPNSKGDFRFKYIIEVVECLKGIGVKNLIIKIKDGNNGNNINILRRVLDISLHSDVGIKEGGFYKYINSTDFVIGGMGTSIVESAYIGRPYYVYEPLYNGVTDNNIKNSILEKKTVFRDIESLKRGILNKFHPVFSKKKLFEGIKMSEIDFKDL